ncbi:MAG: hypothetical protein RB296_09670 [Acidobacteriota bacterium]|jgi:hypothetical protein|nr:hypothetical protein [Acidobacteriota bacterium]
MIFDCLPESSRCEWRLLKPFVDDFNKANKSNYTLKRCLDVVNRDKKEPEVLLESPGLPALVIERKSVVWPDDYLKQHSKFHLIGERLSFRLRGLFTDGVYQFCFNDTSLGGKTDKQLKRDANNVVGQLVANQESIKTTGWFRSQTPFPWRLHRMKPEDKDESTPENGIGVLMSRLDIYDESWESFTKVHLHALEGFKRQLAKVINESRMKFENYSDARRILLLQFFGQNELVMDEDLLEIMADTELPDEIDEFWYACHLWIDESNYQIQWKLADVKY